MITMTEIARLTGVSQPTVSRVLNGNTDPTDRCDRDRHLQLFFCGIGEIHRRGGKKGRLQSDSVQLRL